MSSKIIDACFVKGMGASDLAQILGAALTVIAIATLLTIAVGWGTHDIDHIEGGGE